MAAQTTNISLNGTLPVGVYIPDDSVDSTMVNPRSKIPTVQTTVSTGSEEDGVDCSPCFTNNNIRRTILIIFLGQILSLCLCGMGVASEVLNKEGVHTPAAQSFLSYFMLGSVYGTILVCKTGDNGFLPVLRYRGWKYLILSFLDVQANYLLVYAYQFTNLTSIQLLDCATIPTVLLLSWLLLSTRYLLTHIIGVSFCLVGIAVLIWADVLEGKGLTGGSNRLLGDILCITGSIFYAITNVSEEYLVKHNNRIEYLGMIGLFGSIISGIQSAVTEHRELSLVKWSSKVIILYLIFAACMFSFYSLVTVVMQKSSALMFNLSILSADFYILLMGIFIFEYKFHPLYFLSFFIILIGSILYSLRETKKTDANDCCSPQSILACLSCSDNESGSYDVTPMAPSLARTSTTNSPAAPVTLYAAETTARFCPVHGHPATSSASSFVFNKS